MYSQTANAENDNEPLVQGGIPHFPTNQWVSFFASQLYSLLFDLSMSACVMKQFWQLTIAPGFPLFQLHAET
jgi:hypothetical protein